MAMRDKLFGFRIHWEKIQDFQTLQKFCNNTNKGVIERFFVFGKTRSKFPAPSVDRNRKIFKNRDTLLLAAANIFDQSDEVVN